MDAPQMPTDSQSKPQYRRCSKRPLLSPDPFRLAKLGQIVQFPQAKHFEET
jgi:hypothetical protein